MSRGVTTKLLLSALVLAPAPLAAADTLARPASAQVAESPAASPETSSETRPQVVVETLHTALLDVMKSAGELGYDGRYAKLAPVLQDVFDTSFMGQKSVGKHWKRADEEQRNRLIETFNRFMIANYAGRFDGYSGQYFETLGQQPSTRGTILVQTRLVNGSDDVIELNYRLRETGEDWKIIDVYLNGTVSELALRRSEYSSLIEREGFDALLTALDDKITTLAISPADQS